MKYLKLHDISSAKSYYEKCLNLQGDSENSLLSSTIDNIIFAKGYIKLKNSNYAKNSKNLNMLFKELMML